MHITREALLYLLLAWVAPRVLAEETAFHVNMPTQSLAGALDSLARQAHLQIIYNPDALGAQSSRAVVGTYTPREAVEKLLAGTGMSYTFTAEDTVAVRAGEQQSPPKSANEPASKPDEPTVLPEMTVTATPGQDTGYNVPNATTATKNDTPIMETPVSIQVVPQAVMDDQQVIGVKDALKNISGVQPNLTYGALYDNFIVRGFGTDFSTYRNGLRQTTLGFETTNLEQIEVLKGPAAVLFGRIEPGGLINLVTKRPLAEPYYALQQQFGSYDLYRTTAEATGPLTADGSLLYRLDFAYQDSNSFQDFVFLDRFFVAPALTWRPTDRLEFNLSYEHQEDDLNFANGIPALGRRPAPVPISFSSDDGDDSYERERDLVAFDCSYQFLEGWKVTNRFTAYFVDLDQTDVVGFDTVDENDPIMDRFFLEGVQNHNSYATNLDLTGRFET